jgi:hypothetical protein
MMYIWFALIMRTGYQGVQFDMMLKVCPSQTPLVPNQNS